MLISRRALLAGAAAWPLAPRRALAQAREQGFAGLGGDAAAFAPVMPDAVLRFPDDHGAHPHFRIEWWYVTANLEDGAGTRYGAQWTLFRQAMLPNDDAQGWDSRQVWMGHAALTSADTHRFAETFSRGGIATAGVVGAPLEAFIDDWRLGAEQGFDVRRVAPLAMTASAKDFSLALRLDSDRPLVLQGEAGFSRKSERGQASYYYSQPFYRAAGTVTLDKREIAVSGQAWLDREWSSQPLAADQKGWDWLSLHLDGGDKLMLFRLRGRDSAFHSGNWIAADGSTTQLAADAITMIPGETTRIAGRDVPTAWRIAIASRGFAVTIAPLNPQCWMATRFPYWEGPIAFAGSHRGVGYLEMTGY